MTFFVWAGSYNKDDPISTECGLSAQSPGRERGTDMTVVYIDSLFLLNLIVDYLLLLAAAKLAGEPIRRLRLALGAALGALYAAAVCLPGLGFLAHPLCKLGAAVLMVLLGFGGSRRLLRALLVFFGISCAFGGGIFAIGLLGGRGLSLKNGILYSAMDLRILLLSAAICYVGFTLIFHRTARHTARELTPAVLTLGEKRVALTALVDTGNTLTDPVTGRPVMVAEGEKLSPLLPEPWGRRPCGTRWVLWSASPGQERGSGSGCCPTRRWGWSAGCCWPCGWTGPRWARRTMAASWWPSRPHGCRTEAATAR